METKKDWEKYKKDIQEALDDAKNNFFKAQKELSKTNKCIEYFNLNYYDAKIERDIVGILKFYKNDLKELLKTFKSEKSAYEDELKAVLKNLNEVLR